MGGVLVFEVLVGWLSGLSSASMGLVLNVEQCLYIFVNLLLALTIRTGRPAL